MRLGNLGTSDNYSKRYTYIIVLYLYRHVSVQLLDLVAEFYANKPL